MATRQAEDTRIRFQIEKLEERIAPIVHMFAPVPIFANGAFAASTGNPHLPIGAAGGAAAVAAFGGPIASAGHPVGAPVPCNTPGVGAEPHCP